MLNIFCIRRIAPLVFCDIISTLSRTPVSVFYYYYSTTTTITTTVYSYIATCHVRHETGRALQIALS